MIRIENNATVPYSDEQMFKLVNDIDSYPEFIPGCTGAQREKTTEQEIIATLKLAKGPAHISFTTRNTLSPVHTIILDLVTGPFEKFKGRWEFKSLVAEEGKQSCHISFKLEFSFNNLALKMLLGPLMRKLADQMLDLFVQRAHKIYSPSK